MPQQDAPGTPALEGVVNMHVSLLMNLALILCLKRTISYSFKVFVLCRRLGAEGQVYGLLSAENQVPFVTIDTCQGCCLLQPAAVCSCLDPSLPSRKAAVVLGCGRTHILQLTCVMSTEHSYKETR